MSRQKEFVVGQQESFYTGFHEERTEEDPPNHLEPVILKDSDDTPQRFL